MKYFHNAKFYLENAFDPDVIGLLVAEGKIARIVREGDKIDSAWEKIDLKAGFAWPGFIDAHTHSFSGGLYEDGIDLSQCSGIDEVLSLIFAASKKDSELVIGWRFDETLIPEKRFPTLKELDAVCPNSRLLLRRVDGHSCVLNSKARAAIPGLNSQDEVLTGPENDLAVNWLQDNCSEETILKAYHNAAQKALQGGFVTLHTMIGDADMSNQHYAVIRDRLSEFDIGFVLYPQSFNIDSALELGATRIGGCILADGSIGSRSAALSQPYADSPTHGRLYQSDKFWQDFIFKAHQKGLQICVHCIGDAAINQINSAYAALESSEVRELRHQLIHCELCPDPLLDAIAASGAVPVMQPAFDLLWGGPADLYEQRLGERHRLMNRFVSFAQRGVKTCSSSDWYVTDLNIAMSLHALINHHEPTERLSPQQAIRSYTENNAWLSHEEKLRGSLREGMIADISVTDTDFTQPFDWQQARVTHVIRSGNTVYED